MNLLGPARFSSSTTCTSDLSANLWQFSSDNHLLSLSPYQSSVPSGLFFFLSKLFLVHSIAVTSVEMPAQSKVAGPALDGMVVELVVREKRKREISVTIISDDEGSDGPSAAKVTRITGNYSSVSFSPFHISLLYTPVWQSECSISSPAQLPVLPGRNAHLPAC